MTERRTLIIAFLLNASLAVIEIVAGLSSRSVALLADAADFVEDSVLYILALALSAQRRDVKRSFGIVVSALMTMPAVMALWMVWTRLADPAPPSGTTIWSVSMLALAANLATAALILAARRRETRASLGLKAAWLSSRNDAVANVAMIAAGVAVSATGQGWPDIVAGLGVGILHMTGALSILRGALAGSEGR
jgi:Co/Zn/Cd efflux system component